MRWQQIDAAAFDERTQDSGRLTAIARLAALAGPRVLRDGAVSIDVGCGSGRFAEVADSRAIMGIDVSMAMLHVARERMDRVCQQDLFHLGIRAASV